MITINDHAPMGVFIPRYSRVVTIIPYHLLVFHPELFSCSGYENERLERKMLFWYDHSVNTVIAFFYPDWRVGVLAKP